MKNTITYTKNISMQAIVCNLSAIDVLEYIDQDILDEIKKTDPEPVFAMMTIGYEGEAKGQLLNADGQGDSVDKWYKQIWPLKAVKQLVGYLKTNRFTAIYESHAPEAYYRKAVGNVITGAKKVIDGVTHALAIAHITDIEAREKVLSGTYNACSMEATCFFEKAKNAYEWVVNNVESLTGIALCDTSKVGTGFDNSNILAVVTAMRAETKNEQAKGKDMENVTLRDVKEYIEENDIRPDRLFSIQQLTGSESVKGAFETEHKAETEKKDARIKELEEEIVPFKQAARNQKVSTMVEGSELLKDEYKETVTYIKQTIKVDLKEGDDEQAVVDSAIKSQLALLQSSGLVKSPTDEEKKKIREDNEAGKKTEHKKTEDKKLADKTEDLSANEQDNFYAKKENNPLIA
jgi:hypothetical protein